ncbi:hypothetical protein CERSUDRAFT_113830 [Gelatoporia subvermispora B]|uniref:NYN domain-containing protein n=1 Tax=Ceriporiopsis subvermispora (strain B) TaxID=914234 RepID=M2QNM6_CERS8|nr:hypothetical protein CERSUDRAFT_113830 [Gelatoporia subvermispora B]
MSDPQESVAVFWDYENCSPACSDEGCSIVSNIRQIAHVYGSVKQFKAYLQLSEQSPKSVTLRSDLQSSGVSLTDCPHNGRKDAADKMLLVDMLTFAMDTPAPATIVLISGDRDFVYAVSVLRMRRYRVVLIAPNSTHSGLKSQASIVYDWESHILRAPKTARLPGIEFATPDLEECHRRSRSLTTSTSSPLPATPRSLRRPSVQEAKKDFMGIGTKPALHVDAVEEVRLAGGYLGNTLGIPARLGTRYVGDTNASAIVLSDGDDEPIADIDQMIQTIQRGKLSTSSAAQISPASSPHVTSVDLEAANVRPAFHHRAASAPTLVPLPLSMAPITSEHQTNPPDRISVLLSQTQNNVVPKGGPDLALFRELSQGCTKSALPGTGAPLESTGADEERAFSPDHSAAQLAMACKSEPSIPPAPSTTPAQPQAVPAFANITRPSPTTPTTPLPPIPPHFSILIDLLALHRAQGNPRPLRGTIAVALVGRSKDVYANAGVRRFKDYTMLAESAGIVELGGFEAQAWIALTPAWCGRVAVGS